VTQKIHGSAIEIRGPMSRDHVKELVMGSPHVEEFEVPPALDRMIQTNFSRRVVCKSFRRIKVKMSQALKGRPIWICHNPIKFSPHSTIGPTVVTTSIVHILEAKV
jgi:hypothetical protein